MTVNDTIGICHIIFFKMPCRFMNLEELNFLLYSKIAILNAIFEGIIETWQFKIALISKMVKENGLNAHPMDSLFEGVWLGGTHLKEAEAVIVSRVNH